MGVLLNFDMDSKISFPPTITTINSQNAEEMTRLITTEVVKHNVPAILNEYWYLKATETALDAAAIDALRRQYFPEPNATVSERMQDKNEKKTDIVIIALLV